ncbi:MAG: T9SS type A sorting domain-containing protein [Ignavibacteriales bacterium]|nr:T9SS type A sorting domain-containing protein [Ignavibacteriales bacterium]
MSGGATPPTFAVGTSGTFSVSATGTTISYTATGAQTTGSEWDANFQNATINNSAGVTLGGSKTVSGTLTLTSGNLTLGANNLTLSSAVAGTPSASNHIVTNSSGAVVKNIAASGSYTFPVGYDGSTYNPVIVALDGSSTADNFSVSVASGVSPSAPDNTKAVQATWTISEASAGSSNATLTFQWTGAQEGSGFIRSSSAVWNYISSAWVNKTGGSASGSNPYTVANSTAITDFSSPSFIVGNDGALPVTMTSFTAAAHKSNAVKIAWKTATEVNSYGFEVERKPMSNQQSAIGNWSKVGFVAGSGMSNSPKEYSYTDENLSPGRYAYRIKQVDADGQSTYYGSAEVEVGLVPRTLALEANYPNPFNPSTTMRFNVPENGRAVVRVFNLLGQELVQLFDGVAEQGRFYTVQFNAAQLPSGVYYYSIEYGGKQIVKRMMMLK